MDSQPAPNAPRNAPHATYVVIDGNVYNLDPEHGHLQHAPQNADGTVDWAGQVDVESPDDAAQCTQAEAMLRGPALLSVARELAHLFMDAPRPPADVGKHPVAKAVYDAQQGVRVANAMTALVELVKLCQRHE